MIYIVQKAKLVFIWTFSIISLCMHTCWIILISTLISNVPICKFKYQSMIVMQNNICFIIMQISICLIIVQTTICLIIIQILYSYQIVILMHNRDVYIDFLPYHIALDRVYHYTYNVNFNKSCLKRLPA